MSLLQFGLTNVPDQRLATHRKGGWDVLDVRGPMDGFLAAEWERAFIRFAKQQALTMGKALGQGNFTGYTEAWPSTELAIASVWELMQAVEGIEGQNRGPNS